MPDPVLQKAYDEAAAVFSRSFRFVEWKFVIAAKGTSTPFGDRDEPQRKATKKIDRRKWVYVFRNEHESLVPAWLQEEIRIDKNGDMAATKDEDLGKEHDKRGAPVPLGKTMCLPRRLFGKPCVYRFFASRVRLPLEQIKQLQIKITTFAPPVIFDPGKNPSVIDQDGELLVPVVDPVTVALHLHAAFTAAADDIINYTVAHQENENRKIVERRRKKHLLATLLKSIIGDEKNTGANNLVAKLKGRQAPLEDFLAHYEAQVRRRVDRRDRLGAYLVRWLDSDALKIASAACKGAAKSSWVQFLVPWCQSITRLGESPSGRQYLDARLDDKTHFIHTYVWPEKKLPDDAVQAVRKGGMTILEAWREFAERKILAKGGSATEIIESLQTLLLPTGKPSPLKPIDQVAEYVKHLKTTQAIRSFQLKIPDSSETVHYSADGLKAVGALIESVNLIFAIKSTMEKMKGSNPRERELAIIGLLGSSLDAASAIGSLLKKSENILATLGFISGVIDVYLGHEGMKKAFKDGDQDAANGEFLVASGSAIGTAGVLMPLMALPGGQIVTVVGLLVVALGNIYKMLTSKSPIEVFFARCTWGQEHTWEGRPDWSPADFKDWKGEKEFDYQLEALLNILCKIEIGFGDSFRDLKFRMGWLPPASKLMVRYEEEWKDKADNRTFEGEIVFTDKGPISKTQGMTVHPEGKNGVKLAIAPGLFSQKKTFTKAPPLPNSELKKSIAWGRLIVTFDGKTAFTIPHTGWEKKTFIG